MCARVCVEGGGYRTIVRPLIWLAPRLPEAAVSVVCAAANQSRRPLLRLWLRNISVAVWRDLTEGRRCARTITTVQSNARSHTRRCTRRLAEIWMYTLERRRM